MTERPRTDERLDERMRVAGERWRAAQSTDVPAGPPPPDMSELLSPARRPGARRRFGLAASAALVAAAIAVGGTAVLRSTTDSPVATHANPRPVGLRGTVWKVVGYDAAARDLGSSATLYLGLQSHILIADDDCTLVGAIVGTGPSSISVTSRVVRHRACRQQSGARSSAGLAILHGRASYRVAGNALTISRAGHTMHLVPAPAAMPVPSLDVPTVVGATWGLVSATDPAGRQLRVYKFPRLTIGDNGRLSTGDQCNTITGRAVGTGSRLVFSHMASTRYPCPSQVSGVVGVVAGVLSGTARTSVVGGRLTISKPGGGSLSYLWQPSEQNTAEPARLTGRVWHLALLHGARPVVPATLSFTVGGSVRGSDGCSRVDGRLEIGYGTLTLRTHQAPPAACPRAARAQATMIDSYLSGPDLMWSVRDGRLIISAGGAQADALVLETAPATTLAGQEWRFASSADNTPGRSSSSGWIATSGDIVLTFDGRGGWRLSGRCPLEAGNVVAVGRSALRFGGRRFGNARCPSSSAAERQLYEPIDRVLSGTSTWSIADNTLTLVRAGATVTFTA